MDPMQRFEKDKIFKSTVLRFEFLIDSLIVQNAIESANVEIEAPEDLTLEIFEILWKRYTNIGWKTFSWNQETNKMIIKAI